jgi:hypothetical protein
MHRHRCQALSLCVCVCMSERGGVNEGLVYVGVDIAHKHTYTHTDVQVIEHKVKEELDGEKGLGRV